MINESTPTAPRSVLIVDGARKIEVSGTAAKMIRIIMEQAGFFNAPYSAGVVHFHFAGKEQTVNVKSELDCSPQVA